MYPLASAATEPPTTCSLSGPKLLQFLDHPLQLDLPACSVAVERGVKEVTLAADVCADSKERDGLVFQKIASREKYKYENRNKVYGLEE